MGSCGISHFISSGCFLYIWICISVIRRIMEMSRSGAELFFVLMDVVTFNGKVYFEFVLLSRKKKKEEWNWLHIHYAATMPQTTPCNHFLFSFRVSLFELTDCDSTAGWWIVTKTFRWVCEPLVRHIYNYPAPSSLVFNLQGPAAKHTRRTSLYKSRPVFLHYLVERQKVCH